MSSWFGAENSVDAIWLGIGFLGQLAFTSRFLVQWLASERRRDSVVPPAFWWFSLAGGLTLLSYALYKRDPVIVVGQCAGVLIYTRNLFLIARARRRDEADAPGEAARGTPPPGVRPPGPGAPRPIADGPRDGADSPVPNPPAVAADRAA